MVGLHSMGVAVNTWLPSHTAVLDARGPPSRHTDVIESIHETLRLNPIDPFFSISLTVSDLSKMNVMFYYGI